MAGSRMLSADHTYNIERAASTNACKQLAAAASRYAAMLKGAGQCSKVPGSGRLAITQCQLLLLLMLPPCCSPPPPAVAPPPPSPLLT
jgi:hypothetical protein